MNYYKNQFCIKKRKKESEVKEKLDATSLKGFLKILPGDVETRRAILLLVLHYLPLDSQAKVQISGVLKTEKCLNIKKFVLQEKNKQVYEFKRMATTYLSNCKKDRNVYDITNVSDGEHLSVITVTPRCRGTPFTVACKEGDLNMVQTLLQYWKLWGKALGVKLESSTALVNMAEMPLKTCMDMTTYKIPAEYDRHILRPSPKQLAGIVISGEDIHNENSLRETALYKTMEAIVSKAIVSGASDCFNTYFEIVDLLLKKDAYVTRIFIDFLCVINLQQKHRTRLISIFLPYLNNYLKELLLFKLMELDFDIKDIQKILSKNPLLRRSMFVEHWSVVESLLSADCRFPTLLNLFTVLLKHENWNQKPLETTMTINKKWFNDESHPVTLVDVFYVKFGSWTKPHQELYLKVLHPVILNMTFANTYLHFILNEEVQWREGGFKNHQQEEKKICDEH